MRQSVATIMNPKNISIRDFTYALPDEKIAKYPLPDRDSSRLLIYQEDKIEETLYQNIAAYLPADSLMIFNNSKVVEARLIFQKPTGATIEIFCLEPHIQNRDIASAMSQQSSVEWLCLIGGASKWKPGQILQKKINGDQGEVIVEAKFVGKVKESFAIQLSWTPSYFSFAEILHFAGQIPLPPYLKRDAEPADSERYQTVYADLKGSVASPTAGLHFTEQIFKNLQLKNIDFDYLTLHVGAGTFKPVKSSIMEGHEMHAEFIDVDISTINKLISHPNKFITAVGTTSLRTLESLYWMGVKIMLAKKNSPNDLIVSQWEPYELPAAGIQPSEALTALIEWMNTKEMHRLVTKTQILIAPGYDVKLANALVTNFHQPQSTLLLLVAAFIGPDWRKVYDYALENNFRFLSYGDGCLLFRNRPLTH